MKTAIYIAEGRTQLVLTPETAFEKQALSKVGYMKEATIRTGSFYSCQGGWDRHTREDNSIIIVVDEVKDAESV